MCPLIQEIVTAHTPDMLVENLHDERGIVLLRSSLFDSPEARYSFVTARPFLRFRSEGSRCELRTSVDSQILFGDPWHLLESLMALNWNVRIIPPGNAYISNVIRSNDPANWPSPLRLAQD